VRLPSGQVYWTVLDEDLRVVGVADEFLRYQRFGCDGAESTTKAYAHAIALFLRWCGRSGRSWQGGVERFALFMTWLAHAGPGASSAEAAGGGSGVVLAGPGAAPARSPSRINGVLSAVRGMVVHAVAAGAAPAGLVSLLYEVADDRDLPEAARGGEGRMAWRLRARHRLREPETAVDRASDEEIVALLRACRCARDRLIVLLMARAGLRRGELCGLRRCDVHLLLDSRGLGCEVARAHLHVVRRDNPHGAWAKSRRQRTVPLDFLVVQAFDTYEFERMTVARAADSDFVFVNLFREPLGAPTRPDAIGELMAAASRRAGLEVPVRAHQLRHACASNIADAGRVSMWSLTCLDTLGSRRRGCMCIPIHPGCGRRWIGCPAPASRRGQAHDRRDAGEHVRGHRACP
jgi:integrase/recombinase XerD